MGARIQQNSSAQIANRFGPLTVKESSVAHVSGQQCSLARGRDRRFFTSGALLTRNAIPRRSPLTIAFSSRTDLRRPEKLNKLFANMQASSTKEGILKAGTVEVQLVNDSWLMPNYNLLPHFKKAKAPTLVIYSDDDFIPVSTATNITEPLPNAHMVTLEDCGIFLYGTPERSSRTH